MVFIVLGMHKSGTTLVASLLHQSGVNMGHDLANLDLSYDGKKTESPGVRQINDRLLRSEGVQSIHIKPKLSPDDEIRDMAKQFVSKQQDSFSSWGFKDPRTVFTYPFWKGILPPHKLIIVVRSPEEVLGHYKKYSRSPSIVFRALRSWIKHNRIIFDLMRNSTPQDYHLLDYSHLMTDLGAIKRLGEFVGMTIEDQRDPSLYKSKNSALWIRVISRLSGAVALRKQILNFGLRNEMRPDPRSE